MVDPRSHESRGFGFVTMDSVDGAERCIKYLNRSTLEGRIITVEKVRGLTVGWMKGQQMQCAYHLGSHEKYQGFRKFLIFYLLSSLERLVVQKINPSY